MGAVSLRAAGAAFVFDDRPSLAANLVATWSDSPVGWPCSCPCRRREGRTTLPRQLTVYMATAAAATLGYGLTGGSVQFGLRFGTVTDGWAWEVDAPGNT
ncbi:hypothetical protein [Streptomyces aureocirculatus]|uniref:hypothetical protein n=1 Tax=Streptomyces aureocirculatus TaxID=67275 RepID=UPI0012FE962A|nr:hypothetical protein [Streptomyces aureocirculatus]